MIALVFGLILMAADPAATEPPAPPAGRTTAAIVRKDPEHRICREEARANSRVPRKVCRTAAEWDARTEAARDALGAMQGRTTTQSCSPATGCQ